MLHSVTATGYFAAVRNGRTMGRQHLAATHGARILWGEASTLGAIILPRPAQGTVHPASNLRAALIAAITGDDMHVRRTALELLLRRATDAVLSAEGAFIRLAGVTFTPAGLVGGAVRVLIGHDTLPAGTRQAVARVAAVGIGLHDLVLSALAIRGLLRAAKAGHVGHLRGRVSNTQHTLHAAGSVCGNIT